MRSLELWGGHECTVNRIRNRYLDQSVLSGHDRRISDLALFAELGLSALRYPVLWEKVSPQRPDEQDFRWQDDRMEEIRRLGMRPIVGLCHHGSGPAYTSLLDDDGFARGLAGHARAAAERYPWARDWTPVNEPLTTARFSALYGIWYPHTRSEGTFWRALLNEIDATRLSMREIRTVIPDARLIQTEDLGYCHATPQMQEQADFENERRWITWDLLCGRVTPEHPLWNAICAWGLEDRLRRILDDPCPPDVIGLNHYLSSERLLDHRIELYPAGLRGGDGAGPYVNIEAMRTVASPRGMAALLEETWSRYGRTIAVTECHNGCTREEQMRWFDEVWRTAQATKSGGVDLEAVTAWALLGSYDWNRLLAVEGGHYEPGVFDLREGKPRPTAMARLLRSLVNGEAPSSPALAGRGWWRRPDRLLDQRIGAPDGATWDLPHGGATRRPLLLVGQFNTRCAGLLTACQRRDLAVEFLEVGVASEDCSALAQAALDRANPWAVVALNSAMVEIVDGLRTAAPLQRAAWLDASDAADAAAEVLLVRSPALMSEHELQLFVQEVLQTLEAGGRFRAASNRLAPATYLPAAADAMLDLLIDGETGPVELAGGGERGSWADLAVTVAVEAGLDHFAIEPVVTPSLRLVDKPRAVAGRTLALPPLATAAAARVAGWRLLEAGRSSCPVDASTASDQLRHAAE